MNFRKVTASMLLAVSMGVSGGAIAADIVVGVPNWPSVKATAAILKYVIEDNYGLEVELQSGTNPIIFEAMDQNQMQIHPEVWLPNQQNLHDTFVVEKKSVVMNPYGVPSFTGMCVTKDTAERTGITALQELSDPDMAQNFDSDGDGKGNIWIGANGWASTNIELIRAKSYGFDETMNLDLMDESLAMATVDAAVAKGENVVFMCYTPHHMFKLFDLVVLEEPVNDPEKWIIFHPTDDPDWLEKSSAAVAWSVPTLHVMYASALQSAQPEVAQMLSNVKLTTDQVTAMTYAVLFEKREMPEFAQQWVQEHAEQVNSWLQ